MEFTPPLDEEERKLEKELEKYYKAMRAAMIVNPQLRAFFEEVRRREKVASCAELKGMLEKARMLQDNVEWEDEPEYDLVSHIFSRLLYRFKKRCRKMWIEYTGKLAPKYLREMEEALYWRRVKPQKSKGM